MPVCEMKGLSILNYPVVLGELRGPSVRDDMLGRLPDDLRHKLQDGEIVANGWYPVTWKCALHEAGRVVTGDASLARAMGYEMTKRDLRGIYSMLLRYTVSPRTALTLTARLLGRYLRPARLEVAELGPCAVRFSFSEGDGFTYELWEDVVGGSLATLEIAGARQVVVRIESGGRTGDAAAIGVARWVE